MNRIWSRPLLALSVLLFAAGPSVADQAEEEAAIRKGVDSYTAAFNKHDAKAIAAHWLPDAVYIDPDSGVQVVGRDAIEKHFAKEFEGLKKAKLQVAVESIRFVSPHVAVESGVAVIHAKAGKDAKDVEVSKSNYTAVHVKRDGKWLLDRVTEQETPVIVSHYENLKDLQWMVGNWVDAEDDATTIETQCSWAKNQNYLVRTFSITIRDQIATSGLQIIGWDPAAKKIRSWVFDSDGGFGEGIWTKKGKAWYVQTKDTLPTGQKASAVNILTPVDKNSFTWQTTDRQSGGFLLPNVGEVTVVRKLAQD